MKQNKIHNIKNAGFKTPDNYFSAFEDNLLTEISLKEKVTTSGFKTTDTYFEDFKVDLPKNESQPKVIPLFTKKPWLYVASIAATIILIVTLTTKKEDINFAALDTEGIENYMLINDFSVYDLSNLINDQTAFQDAIFEETLSDASIEDYLYNNAELEDISLD